MVPEDEGLGDVDRQGNIPLFWTIQIDIKTTHVGLE